MVSGVEEGGIIQGLTESENRLFQGGDIPREPKSAEKVSKITYNLVKYSDHPADYFTTRYIKNN